MSATTVRRCLAIALPVFFGSAAHAGIVEYSWDASATDVVVGDTVTLTLHASIEPENDPFWALAMGMFDVRVDDPILGGASLDNAGPGLGLHSDFTTWGDQGTLVGDDVLAVQAAQVSFFGSPVNTSTELEILTLELTITDATARSIIVDVDPISTLVYDDSSGTLQTAYDATTVPVVLSVSPVPAPGALALLAGAGLIGAPRRRRG